MSVSGTASAPDHAPVSPLDGLAAPLLLALMAVGYAALSHAGEWLMGSDGVSVFWPASGFAAVMLLWARTPTRRGVVLAGIVVGLAINAWWRQVLLPNELGYLIGNLLEPAIMLPFLIRATSTSRRLDRPTSVAWLLAGGVVATSAAAAVVATFGVWSFDGTGDPATWWPVWESFALGDLVGLLIVAPLLLQAVPVSHVWSRGGAAQQVALWLLLAMAVALSEVGSFWVGLALVALVLIALVLDSSAAALAVLIVAGVLFHQWRSGHWGGLDSAAGGLDIRLMLVTVAILVQCIALSTTQRRLALQGQVDALRRTEEVREVLSAVLAAAPVGIAMYSVAEGADGQPTFSLEFMNDRGSSQGGHESGELQGSTLEEFSPESADTGLVERLGDAWRGHEPQELIIDHTGMGSSWPGVYLTEIVPAGRDRLVVAWTDITQITEARREAEENWNLLRRALDSGLDAFLVLERAETGDWRVAFVNTVVAERAGAPARDLRGTPTSRAVPPEALARVRAMVRSADETRQPQHAVVDLRDAQGWWGDYDVVATPASRHRVVVSWRDVSDLRSHQRALVAAHDEAVAASRRDPLTGLANRSLLREHMVEARENARQTGTLVAVAYLDVDSFKSINDTYGHDVGDTVLVSIAERLKAAVRAGDTAARLGGDEFVLLMTSVTPAWDTERFRERIATVRSLEVNTRGTSFRVTVSAGLAVAGPDTDPQEIMRQADSAMYGSKQQGLGGFVRFEPPAATGASGRPAPEIGL